MARRIVIIGSGAAGLTAASAARKKDKDARITVITEDEHIAYSPCAIPWVLEGVSEWKDIIMHDPAFYKKERDIDVLIGTRAESVDGAAKKVVAGGKEHIYDSLVIATGGTVFVPPVPGKDLKNVFVVRTIMDGMAIEKAMKDSESAVICGAGVIGLEMAVAMRNMGLKVTVIEMMGQIIPRIADPDMAVPIQEHLESRGIKFVLNAPVQGVNGTDKVEGVTAAGENYECDMVVFATGVRANLEIPRMLGLDIGQLGAVAVSPSMQPYVKGRLQKDIFVAGDLIQCQSAPGNGPTMSQLGSSAVRQGAVAGTNAAGGNETLGPVCSPWISRIGGMEIGGTGLSHSLAEWYGIKSIEGKASGSTRARYHPGGKALTVKISADASSHKIIGAQILAGENANGRINWITGMIARGETVESLLSYAENAYCPPTSMVKDVVLSAAEDLRDKITKVI
ncbi:MAG: NAD(P)/FAD-dependent oxidoreductase [Candidatus Methanomethylophilaceae archaeon]|jgi:NADH oxidase (H2O2-forming)|nr:FAD/NAD(P)-binding oxidoreductase [Candidatus Methanomethylophilaceae archaeon]MDI9378412.1 FAD/NAD(P)-binding oxidoreductase [Candidatus Thermoplasmatota archaeon]